MTHLNYNEKQFTKTKHEQYVKEYTILRQEPVFELFWERDWK
jgi:hypothetical protein